MRQSLISKGLVYQPERGRIAFTVPGMADYIHRHPTRSDLSAMVLPEPVRADCPRVSVGPAKETVTGEQERWMAGRLLIETGTKEQPVNRLALAMTAALVVLAGCTPAATPSTPTGSTPTVAVSSATPTPTSTPTPVTPAERASQRGIEFFKMLDLLAKDTTQSIDLLHDYARGEAFDVQMKSLMQIRVDGLHQAGDVKITPLTTEPGESARQWVARYCLNVSGVDLVDANGKSHVAAGRKPQLLQKLWLDEDAKTGVWYVTKERTEGESC